MAGDLGQSGDWEWRVTWLDGGRKRERIHRTQTAAMASAGFLTAVKERGGTYSDIRVWCRERTPWRRTMQSRFPGGE